MTQQESEDYEALWAWFNTLDAVAEAAQAGFKATLVSGTVNVVARSLGRSNIRRRVGEDSEVVRAEWAAACL